ncbi:hypothetical protein [Halegenticoccus tardaugens]|uniref:hypothetical protein n=1 Tax=Halegenticoccus tardaugens TaxID=2071624 RepID=UPI001E5059DA|nr:hypothetical protein [Halegenticoccus tardaugens]
MAHRSNRTVTARVERWLDYVFFAGMEVCVLGMPALFLLLFAPNPVAVSLSATAALVATVLAVGTFRGGYVGDGRWPAAGDLVTLPIRSAYYSGLLGLGSYLGGAAQLATGRWWVGVVVPVALIPALLAPLPRVLAGVRRTAKWSMGA